MVFPVAVYVVKPVAAVNSDSNSKGKVEVQRTMGIKLNCPTCGLDYDVHPALAGQPLDCSDCGVSFTVPTSSAPSESSDKEDVVVVEESGAVSCPGCDVRYAVEGLASGTQVECSDCGASFSIQVHDAPQISATTEPTSNPVSPDAPVSDAPEGKKSSTLSVVSLVLGLGGLPTCGLTAIPAIICGHLALGRIKKGHGDGRGMALTGAIAGYIFGIGALCVFTLFTQTFLTMFTNFPEHAKRKVVYEKYKDLLVSIDTCVADSDSVYSLAANLKKIEKPNELLYFAFEQESWSNDLFDDDAEEMIEITRRFQGECTDRVVKKGSGYGQLNGKPIIIIEYAINFPDVKYFIIYLQDSNESSSHHKGEEIKDEDTGRPWQDRHGSVDELIAKSQDRGREKAPGMGSTKQLKKIALGLIMYAGDDIEWGNFPEKDNAEGLNELIANDYLWNGAYVNPSSKRYTSGKDKEPLTEKTCSYIYFGGLRDTNKYPSDSPLAFDKPGVPGNTRVLFVDGQVESLQGPFDSCEAVIKALDDRLPKGRKQWYLDKAKSMDERRDKLEY